MRILHIWNTAGVPQTIAKYQRILGHDVKVITRRMFNLPGFEGSVRGGTKQFYIRSILKSFRYNIIHVHALDKIVPILKKISNKPVVLTYHGSDIRRLWGQKKKFWKKADFISVTTPDLLEEAPDNVRYLENPVDIEHFKRLNDYIPHSALFVSPNLSDQLLNFAKTETDARGLKLSVQDRSKWLIPYSIYPRFLELFEYYIDIKECFGKVNPAMSYSALQFLALGGKVIFLGKQYESNIISDPIDLAKKWIDIYNELK